MAGPREEQTIQAQEGDAAQTVPKGPILEAVGISRSFGPVEVLSDVSVAFRAGETHAIIGENGAGKSTLMKILSGHLAPTRGAMRLDGAPMALRGPVDAERRGVVLVHQEIMPAPDLTIAENMFLGRDLWRGPRLDDELDERAREEAMRVFGVDVAVDTSGRPPVDRPAAARPDRPRAGGAHRIVIFDEPTASLTPVEPPRS